MLMYNQFLRFPSSLLRRSILTVCLACGGSSSDTAVVSERSAAEQQGLGKEIAPPPAEATTGITASIQVGSNGLAIGAPAEDQHAFQMLGAANCADVGLTLVPGGAQATGTLIGGQQRVVKTGVLTWDAIPKSGQNLVGTLTITLDNTASYRRRLSVPGSGVTGSCDIRSSSVAFEFLK